MQGFKGGKAPEAPIENLTIQIQLVAEETADAFIFKTIAPFCKELTKQEIQKKDLEQALIHYFPKKRKTSNGFYTCPTCYTYITSNQAACDNCGQRLEVP